MKLLRLNKNSDFIFMLSKIREKIPSAIIAGGAIRDLYHNKQINDIDIYIPATGSHSNEIDDVQYWKQLFDLKTSGLFSSDNIRIMNPESCVGYENNNHIGMVWEITKAEKLYNLIVTDIDPTEYVTKYFDIGLCKAYCDGTRIKLTADFMHDSIFKRLTVVSNSISQEGFNHMMEHHVEKLKNKYPAHTLVIPPEYDEQYKKYTKNL